MNGYTVHEMCQLARSALPAQRAFACRHLAALLVRVQSGLVGNPGDAVSTVDEVQTRSCHTVISSHKERWIHCAPLCRGDMHADASGYCFAKYGAATAHRARLGGNSSSNPGAALQLCTSACCGCAAHGAAHVCNDCQSGRLRTFGVLLCVGPRCDVAGAVAAHSSGL